MKKATLSFHLRPRQMPHDDFDASDRYSQEFCHGLGLKVHSGCWSSIDLDSPVFPEFIRLAHARIAHNEATFYGVNRLTIDLVDAAEYEWYELYPNSSFANEGTDTPLKCKAFKMQPTVHTAHGRFLNPYVSERFVNVVQRHQLTGLEFLWIKDIGKYKAPQWFIPVPQFPLGRGVDHPWYQPPMLDQWHGLLSRGINWRMGVWRFDLKELKRSAPIPSPYRDVFDLYRMSDSKSANPFSLTIEMYKTYLRAFLPAVDFAYIWDVAEERRLCLSCRARAILLAEGLVKPDELKPIRVVDQPPPGCRQLDGVGIMPPSVYTPEQMASLNAQLAADWQKHLATEKPVRVVKLEEALSLLRQAKRDRPDDFVKGAKATAASALPEDWSAVLAISNGGILADECELLSLNEIVQVQREKTEEMTGLFDTVPFDPPLIPIALGPSGDWYGIDTRRPDAARVLRISHEDWSTVDAWDSLPLFVYDMLSGYYD